MSAPLTFLEVLKAETMKFQANHPDRENEIARASALILQGMITPHPDDPATATVISSDGRTTYSVNGSCTCRAGQHDTMCKHRQSWLLYQHVAKKVEAQAPSVQDSPGNGETQPLYEAPASLNLKVLIGGHETQITLRDSSEDRLLERLQVLLKNPTIRPVPKPAPKSGSWKQRGR